MTHLGTIARPRTVSADVNQPTLSSLLAARAVTHGETAALLHKRYGIWHRRTWRQLDSEVTALARALVARGVAVGDRVLIAGANRPRLLAGLFAAQRAAAMPVLVPQVGAGVPLAQAMAQTAPRLALVADVHDVDALRAAPCETVVYDDKDGLRGESRPWLVSWETFSAAAAAHLPPPPGPNDPAAVVYIADETDGFRAVTLSHTNLIAATQRQAQALDPPDRIFGPLPFGWGEPLLLGPVLALQTGASLGFPESDTTVLNDLREFGPTVLAGPAALFRRLRQIAWTEAVRAAGLGRKLLQQGLGFVGDDGAPNRLAAALVAGPTRDRLGLARLRHALCYGEPMPPRIVAFLAALGVRLTGFTAPTELRQAELGSRDSTVPMPASAEALLARLRGSPYVRDALLVATENDELAALLALDGETVATWAQSQGLPIRSTEALEADDRVHALIAGEIAAAATSRTHVAAYLLAAGGFDTASGETTPEGWLRPAIVERAHATALQRLRRGSGRPVAVAVTHPVERAPLADRLAAAAFHGSRI
jgi:long-subunit acyl-CoA synthetase (AMP-forming)